MRHLGRRGNKFVAVAAFVEQLIGVRFLKIARPDGGAGDMRGYGDDRGIAPVGVVQAVDEVDVPWAARPRAGREFFGKLGFGSGGEGGRFLMPHMDEPDAPVTAERVGYGVEAVAYQPVQPRDAASASSSTSTSATVRFDIGMPPEERIRLPWETFPES